MASFKLIVLTLVGLFLPLVISQQEEGCDNGRTIEMDAIIPDVYLPLNSQLPYNCVNIRIADLTGSKGLVISINEWNSPGDEIRLAYTTSNNENITSKTLNRSGVNKLLRTLGEKRVTNLTIFNDNLIGSKRNIALTVSLYLKTSEVFWNQRCRLSLNENDSDEDDSEEKRELTYFLHQTTTCNNRRNCPGGEDEATCDKSSPNDGGGGISWYDVQYLLTILLAGLFFILSPICIVIFLFYHRRMSAALHHGQHNHNGHARNHRTGRESSPRGEVATTSTSSSQRDELPPPSYDDLHDMKTPPPAFDATVLA